jgi:hypothetical protein
MKNARRKCSNKSVRAVIWRGGAVFVTSTFPYLIDNADLLNRDCHACD